MIDQIGAPFGSWVRFAVLTGLRLGEQFGMKGADVDLDRGILTLPHTKAGHVQYAHLNEEAKTEEVSISNGTVTKTVTGTNAEGGRPTEGIENAGAGDGI